MWVSLQIETLAASLFFFQRRCNFLFAVSIPPLPNAANVKNVFSQLREQPLDKKL
jgi:hypothetical protein